MRNIFLAIGEFFAAWSGVYIQCEKTELMKHFFGYERVRNSETQNKGDAQ